MAEQTAPGLRERNKARTRQALLEAARELAGERGLDRVTIEDITERAGVSRRTFFNYFAGIEALVAESTAVPLQRIAEAFLRRPPAEDPLAAVVSALRDRPLDDSLLGWQPSSLRDEEAPRGHRVHLQLWKHHEDWLVGVLRQRLGDGDPLLLRTLAATVMTLFETTEESWRSRRAGLSDHDAVALFNAELVRALELARSGWRPS